MLRHSFMVGLAIVSTTALMPAAIAVPLLPSPVPQPGATPRRETDAPLCYIQFQGSTKIDVSNVCGKTPGETPTGAAATISSASAPPVFDPKMMNASTTGQCNFVDANGNPCPQKP